MLNWTYWNTIRLCKGYGWKSINGVESTEPAEKPEVIKTPLVWL
jgi:hypothetical protein